jgi:cell division protein FtsX
MDYNALENMTVIKLREEAKKLPDVKNVGGMNKEELINLLVEKLEITVPEKKTKKKAASTPKNKVQIKQLIVDLKTQKDAARADKDSKKNVDVLRKRIHSLKRHLRKLG